MEKPVRFSWLDISTVQLIFADSRQAEETARLFEEKCRLKNRFAPPRCFRQEGGVIEVWGPMKEELLGEVGIKT